MKKKTINFLDNRVSDIFEIVLPKVRSNSKTETLINLYSTKTIEEVSWLQVCKDAEEYSNYRLLLLFLIELLKQDLYQNDYADTLKKFLPTFEEITETPIKHYSSIFCGAKIQTLQIKKRHTANNRYSFIQKKEEDIIIADNRISEIINTIIPKVKNTPEMRSLTKLYLGKSIDEISWVEICNDVRIYKHNKFMFLFVIELLNQGLYKNDYADELYKLLPEFNKLPDDITQQYKKFFCGNKITDLIIYRHTRTGNRIGFDFLPSQNTYLKALFIDFLKADRIYTRWIKNEMVETLVLSLGCCAEEIHSVDDFSDTTFWEQVNFYKDFYKDNDKLKTYSLRTIFGFYRWLYNTFVEHDIFENSYTMTRTLLFQKSIVRLIKEDYHFTPLNPHNHPGDKKRICFILKGFESASTTLTSEDNLNINISRVEDSSLRYMFISYIITASNLASVALSSNLGYICDSLKFVTDMKSQRGYPNPDLKYMTNQEAVLIRKFQYDENLDVSTLNNRIGSVRRFLTWAKDTKNIDFDDMFFDYLTQYDEPTKNNGNAISDEKLIALNKHMIDDIKNNKLVRIYYLIFHLLIQTEFRISKVCHLKPNDIKPTAKPNQHLIYTNSKTSNGDDEKYVITELTYHMLMSYIEDTEEIRDNCNNPKLSNYIFLYEGFHKNHYVVTPKKFNNYLKSCCKSLDFPETYSAINLRDTHMTKSLEHNMRHNKSDLELKVLSGHKYIDTTKNHYIELELEMMLEATYGIIIGDRKLIDADSKLVEEIPEHLKSKEFDVEDGCGKCTHDHCVISSSLPCMSCKHFITTVEHEKYFIKAIDNVDRLIQQSSTRHDIEDLVTIKTLYVLYLQAIYNHKEAIND